MIDLRAPILLKLCYISLHYFRRSTLVTYITFAFSTAHETISYLRWLYFILTEVTIDVCSIVRVTHVPLELVSIFALSS